MCIGTRLEVKIFESEKVDTEKPNPYINCPRGDDVISDGDITSDGRIGSGEGSE